MQPPTKKEFLRAMHRPPNKNFQPKVPSIFSPTPDEFWSAFEPLRSRHSCPAADAETRVLSIRAEASNLYSGRGLDKPRVGVLKLTMLGKMVGSWAER